MDRTFQSKIGGWYWLLIALSAIILFFFFWVHQVLVALIVALAVIFEIEMLVHTRYVITDRVLRIETGRFIRGARIPLDQIVSLCEEQSMHPAPALSFKRISVVYRAKGKRHTISISPANQPDFVKCLAKRNPAIQLNV